MLRRPSILAVVALLWSAAATAEPRDLSRDAAGERTPAGSFFTFVWENDRFSGTDRNYTNGLRLSFTRPAADDPVAATVANTLLRASPRDGTLLFRSFAIGQSIFTPEDLQAIAPLPDQHPYAGWLYGEWNVIAANPCRRTGESPPAACTLSAESLTLQIGIIGPSAQGEFVQNTFHRWIGAPKAHGWANQLHDELGIDVLYDRRWQLQHWSLGAGPTLGRQAEFGFDVVPSYGWAAGNILTQASAGLTIRFGTDLGRMDLPARVRPSTPGAGLFGGGQPFAWYVFASAEGRAVARNIFLDGNTFRDSLRVDKRPFVADFQLGAVVRLSNIELAYTYVTRTEEFETQGTPQQFGSFSITSRF